MQDEIHHNLSLRVSSLPADEGGLRSKTERECVTFKSAIVTVYAFSLSLAYADSVSLRFMFATRGNISANHTFCSN